MLTNIATVVHDTSTFWDLIIGLLILFAPGTLGALAIRAQLKDADRRPGSIQLFVLMSACVLLGMCCVWLAAGYAGVPGKYSDHTVALGAILGFTIPIALYARKARQRG